MGSEAARRVVGLVVATAAAVVLGIALSLSPDPRGHGTHEQLGLPACNWVANFGIPCPTCGMTTAFTLAVRGDIAGSFIAQPAGFLLAILTGCALLVGLYVSVTGSSVVSLLGRVWGMRVTWAGAGILIAAWVFKIVVYREVL